MNALIFGEQMSRIQLVTGKGPCYATVPTGRYETGDEAVEKHADEEALQRLPARMLADKLVRRIAVSQDSKYCSETDK